MRAYNRFVLESMRPTVALRNEQSIAHVFRRVINKLRILFRSG